MCTNPMGDGHSIINLGDISKPANTLIKKISGAVGGLFQPYQIKRVAKAEAEANIIRAQAEVDVTDLQRRAITRFVAEEAKRQENIESITSQAIPQLTESATPEKLEDDWITNFFDKCRIISDKEMQALWAKVLSGEANAPGTYSKRTVDFLGTLDRTDADAFLRVIAFGWMMGDIQPLVFELNDPIYKNAGIDFALVTHLDDIGLINFEHLTGFMRMGFPKQAMVWYFGAPIILDFTGKQELQTGRIVLTKTGKQLAAICDAKPVAGLIEYVVTRWTQDGIVSSSPRAARGSAPPSGSGLP